MQHQHRPQGNTSTAKLTSTATSHKLSSKAIVNMATAPLAPPQYQAIGYPLPTITEAKQVNERLLIDMLSTIRPNDTVQEQAFTTWLIMTLQGLGYRPMIDSYNNIVVNNASTATTEPQANHNRAKRTATNERLASSQSLVMFTSHTDSVHTSHKLPPNQFMQWVEITESEPPQAKAKVTPANARIVKLASENFLLKKFGASKKPLANSNNGYQADCLGADCVTGVYLMLRLLANDCKGVYCFFRDEEIGRIGSEHLAQNGFSSLTYPADYSHKLAYREANANAYDLLEATRATKITDFTHCIAFDRKATNSIITHQLGKRCCSQAFADDLAHKVYELSDNAIEFEADPTGSFTDSASFTHAISECTNISVGYYKQHTEAEYQDLDFAERLATTLCKLDYTSLVSERKPSGSDSYNVYDSYSWLDDYSYYPAGYSELESEALIQATIDDLAIYGADMLDDIVYNDPELARELLARAYC